MRVFKEIENITFFFVVSFKYVRVQFRHIRYNI